MSVYLLYYLEDVFDNQRCKPERRLIHHYHLRPRHQRPCHRQHLLLSPRECASKLPVPFLESRKEGVYPFNVVIDAILPQVCTYLQILKDGKVGKDLPSLRNQCDSPLHYVCRLLVRDILSIELNLPASCLHKSCYRPERRTLTCAICTDKCDYRAVRY